MRDTELAVLSCCLSDNRVIFDVAAKVGADDFTDAGCAAIWRRIVRVHGERQPVDAATILPGLSGDTDALQAFADASCVAYHAGNVAVYADAVRDAAMKKRVLRLATDLQGMAKEGTGSDLVAAGIERLTALQTRQAGNASRFSDAFLTTETAIRDIRERRKRGEIAGAPTGIPDLDDALGGITGPRLIIIAARPAVGKTAMLNLAAFNMARKGFPGLIFSLEMSADALVVRAIAAQVGCNVTALSRGDPEAFDKGFGADVGDVPLWLDCDTYDLPSICAQAAMYRHKHGIAWIAVDHIGLVETPRFSSRNDQLGHVSRTLKQLAKRLSIPVIALSQLSRECERDKRKPQLADLRDSGNIEQDADQVVFLHSPYEQKHEPTRPLLFGVLKNRGGRTGWIENYQFEGATQRIRPVSA